MPRERKVHVNVRLDPDHYDIVKNVADILFFDQETNRGNFSKAINYVIRTFSADQEIGNLLSLMRCKAEYDRGIRTQPVIDGAKQFERFIAKIGED
jgi:uncharacterized Fe-S cluster-containing MiaB family protein